jgi:hypothetical protein
MCNQNFDRQKFYHCVAQSNENWMVWNFQQKQNSEEKDITSHVPKFVNAMSIMLLSKLSREVNSYGVIVTCMKGESPVVHEFI